MGEKIDYKAKYEALEAEVGKMANVLRCLDTLGTWESMTCTEVESIADLMRHIGRGTVADMIIELHAEGDEWEDMHHPDYDPEEMERADRADRAERAARTEAAKDAALAAHANIESTINL